MQHALLSQCSRERYNAAGYHTLHQSCDTVVMSGGEDPQHFLGTVIDEWLFEDTGIQLDNRNDRIDDELVNSCGTEPHTGRTRSRGKAKMRLPVRIR